MLTPSPSYGLLFTTSAEYAWFFGVLCLILLYFVFTLSHLGPEAFGNDVAATFESTVGAENVCLKVVLAEPSRDFPERTLVLAGRAALRGRIMAR